MCIISNPSQISGRKKMPGDSIDNVKMPTPVANNRAAAQALAIGNNNIGGHHVL